MSRELIVSVNGREKKIAIVENDRVTEFYIERGEQNQGIVGNLYKGRVMRVLPGMQSAFVDIGLERDAFLYVSDFFDEEAEFERIVVDTTRKGDVESAQKAAADQIEQARIEREQQIEASHERAEPLLGAEAPALSEEAELAEETPTRRRGRRGGRGRGRSVAPQPLVASTSEHLFPTENEPIETPFVSGVSFERVSDEEECVTDGEMLKDARLQERIMDEVHAIEFDLEDVPTAEVGSLLSSGLGESGEFQRVDDGGFFAETLPARPHEIEPAYVRDFVDEIVDESSRSINFQRVSDEEQQQAEADENEERSPRRSGSKKTSAQTSDRRRKRSGVIGRFFKSKK